MVVSERLEKLDVIDSLEINEKAMILAISDVHIGAIRTTRSLFNEFLIKIKTELTNGVLQNLRALVVLGDCFDKMVNSYKDLSKFNDLFDNLQQLHSKKVKLIFALGNHEVSVKGDYDSSFLDEKNTFLNEINNTIKHLKLSYSFFDKEYFTQYVFLRYNENSKPQLFLYDTKQQIADEKVVKDFTLDINEQGQSKINCLFTHGFQFDPHLKLYSRVWHSLLKVPHDVVKETANIIWNGVLKKIYNNGKRLIDIGKKTIRRRLKILINNIKLPPIKNPIKLINSYLRKVQRSDIYRDKIKNNKPYIRKIHKKFLPELKNKGYLEKISHVIFGHTHHRLSPKYQRYKGFLKRSYQRNISIYNTGAWQHVDKPSFIEICTDGSIKLKKIPIDIGDIEKII